MRDSVDLKRVSGADIADYLADVARLRIAVFRDFPYIYDGTVDYERKYLQTYADCPYSLFVLALDEGRVVGASTALPMAYEEEAFRKPFRDGGYDVDKVFYCAESVLLPEYRGRGLGWRFFDEREAHARELGGFEYSTFCAVHRPEDHPLRPADYKTLENLWTTRGYRQTGMVTRFRWKDIDQPGETDKPMVFWLRAL